MIGVERMKSFYIIANPHANYGKAQKDWQKVKKSLDDQKIDYRSQETTKVGDAKEYSMSFLHQLKYADYKRYVIIVIGGTGTLNEVLSGIKEADVVNLPIGFISVGQHHQFADEIGIARNPLIALKQILETTEPEKYSLVQYYETNHEETGYFLDSYSIGLGAMLANIRSREKHHWLRNHIKWLADFINLCKAYYNSLDSFKVTLRIGHKYKFYKRAFIVNLRNHAHESDFTSDHDPLDLVIIDRVNIFTFMIFLLVSRFSDPLKLPFVHQFRANNMHLTVNSLEQTQIDSREVGGKYNDLYLKMVDYPLWVNIDSVSPADRRKE